MMQKSAEAFRTISEVADDLSLPQHVLRFWETRFPQIRPLKRAGGRRYYRPADILLLKTVRKLLYDDGYTIKGVQRLLKEQSAKGLGAAARVAGPATLDTPYDDELSRLPSELCDALAEPPFSASVTILGDAHRDTIKTALASIDECRRILEALNRPST